MKKTVIIGRYNAHRFQVVQLYPDGGEDQLYEAGNSPTDSQVFTTAELGVGLETMKEWCTQTAQEYSCLMGWEFTGVEPLDEDEFELDVAIELGDAYREEITKTVKSIISSGCVDIETISMSDLVAIATLLVAESHLSGTAWKELNNIRKFV